MREPPPDVPPAPQVHAIEHLAALGPIPLQQLYVAANKVPAIVGLEQLSQLTVLELGSNRIKQARAGGGAPWARGGAG